MQLRPDFTAKTRDRVGQAIHFRPVAVKLKREAALDQLPIAVEIHGAVDLIGSLPQGGQAEGVDRLFLRCGQVADHLPVYRTVSSFAGRRLGLPCLHGAAVELRKFRTNVFLAAKELHDTLEVRLIPQIQRNSALQSALRAVRVMREYYNTMILQRL